MRSTRAGLRSAVDRLRVRLGGIEGVVLVALLVLVSSALLFGWVADEVEEGSTARFDRYVLQSLRNPADPARPVGPAWMGKVARDVTALGGWPVLSLLTMAVLGLLVLLRRWKMAGLVALAVGGGEGLAAVLKTAFSRARPEVVPHLVQVSSWSFPSGHSMLSAVVYLTLGALSARLVAERRVKVYIVAVAVLLAALIGLSRIFLGVHFPTDVVAGWAAGLAWATVCWLAVRALERRGTVRPRG